MLSDKQYALQGTAAVQGLILPHMISPPLWPASKLATVGAISVVKCALLWFVIIWYGLAWLGMTWGDTVRYGAMLLILFGMKWIE